MDVSFIVAGFIVGAFVGLSGMGGGSLMTPLLILVFGVNPVSAVGTDLLFAAITKAMASRVHAHRGNVDWGVVGLLASGSIPGAMITIIVLAHIPARDSRLSETITTVIGVALLVAAVGLLFQGLTDRVVAAGAKIGLTVPPGARHTLTAFAGLLLGVFVSLTSVGAGAAGIAAIRQLYPSLAIVRLVGSDIAHAVPLTLLAGSGHWLLGDVQWKLLTLLLIGSIPGIILASRLAHYIPEAILRRVLGLVLLPTAAAMLFL